MLSLFLATPSSAALPGSNAYLNFGETSGEPGYGETSGPSGQASGPINQQTVFTLSCTGIDGSNIRETASVGVVPVFKEI